MKNLIKVIICVIVFLPVLAFADFYVPVLPVVGFTSAGIAVLGLVAAYVVIKIAIHMIKSA